jgi:hypothetical protein
MCICIYICIYIYIYIYIYVTIWLRSRLGRGRAVGRLFFLAGGRLTPIIKSWQLNVGNHIYLVIGQAREPRPTVPQSLKHTFITKRYHWSRNNAPFSIQSHCTILDPAPMHHSPSSHHAQFSILTSVVGQGTVRPGPWWCAVRCCAVRRVSGAWFGGGKW